MAIVDVRNLSVEINGKTVLQDVNIKFHTQERILILGESGSGKSTLLLSLMGIIQRFDNADVTGDILIDGISVRDMKLYDTARIFGMVFQNPESQFCSLYPRDEVAFGLENQCIDPKNMPSIINKSMKDFDFPKEKENQLINTLSGGEQQRLALSSIAAIDSKMLLLDEPTANLDPKGRRQVVKSAKKAGLNGKGLMVVEHNLENWLPFLERLIVIDRDGGILCDGNIREVFYKHGELLREKGIWCPHNLRIYRELKKRGHSFSGIPCNIEELKKEKVPQTLLKEVIENNYKIPDKANIVGNKPILKLEKLSAGYAKNKPILKEIDLTVKEGDFFALVGGNGSGKSTLSKVILKLVDVFSGSLYISGKELSLYKERELYDLIGYVFQNPEHQFLEDTVWSEVAYSIDQLTMDENSRNEEVNSLLKDFHLEKYATNNPFSLSGGQKRRLSVATMLVGERKILILDEPTFGQDEKNTIMLMKKLTELNQQGMTIFMITHDLDLVDSHANRTAVMSDGEILYSGDTQELWNEHEIIRKSGLHLPYRLKLMNEVNF
ncbi:ABC transporter ATP-binding protein [uncultured Ilyobacter sp.]|uniref:ABC transporter ATP-binding protein n=1 Tax=uncultured Ilyobacter sp. TaxID=544433 RepID=UPI0029F50FD2|nr:ABC transporter ATP-binding protein [uncultured Ilyobacter sp.]